MGSSKELIEGVYVRLLLGGEGESMGKGKIPVQIHPWHVAYFFQHIPCIIF